MVSRVHRTEFSQPVWICHSTKDCTDQPPVVCTSDYSHLIVRFCEFVQIGFKHLRWCCDFSVNVCSELTNVSQLIRTMADVIAAKNHNFLWKYLKWLIIRASVKVDKRSICWPQMLGLVGAKILDDSLLCLLLLLKSVFGIYIFTLHAFAEMLMFWYFVFLISYEFCFGY